MTTTSSKRLTRAKLVVPCVAEPEISFLPLESRLTVLNYENDILTVKIKNQSGYTMSYSNETSLYKQRKGQWICLYQKLEDEIITLDDLKEISIDIDLSDLSPLTRGKYQLKVDELDTFFSLK